MKRLFAIAALVGALSTTCVNLAAAQEPYLGEVRLFGFNFCPVGWAPAAGQTLNIAQYTALFALYGTVYGGNGTTTFALPNLSGRAPYGIASSRAVGRVIGEEYGASTVTLTVAQLPPHTHRLMASSAPDTTNQPDGALLPTASTAKLYAAAGSPTTSPTAAGAIFPAGGGQPISIQSPALSMNWCVAMQGLFPSRP